jgi:hypothetical protein
MVMRVRVWSGVLPGLLFLFLLAACSDRQKPVSMIVSNPIDLQRVNEGVVVPMTRLPGWITQKSAILRDQAGRILPFQCDDLNGDGKADEFYFQISLAPQETMSLQIQADPKGSPGKSPFKVLFDHDLVSIETPTRILVSKGPEEMQVFLPPRKASVLTAGYSLPGLTSQESQNRLLSEGPLRVVVEQKALWRSASEAYILNHRINVAVEDPLVRSVIEKSRWPQGAGAPSLAFEVEAGGYQLKSFSTRWLLTGEKSKAAAWNAAVLFRAGTLLQPRPVTVAKDGWRQIFNNESNTLSLAWMITGEGGQMQGWDRQTERVQQRWLNPIEVFVAE